MQSFFFVTPLAQCSSYCTILSAMQRGRGGEGPDALIGTPDWAVCCWVGRSDVVRRAVAWTQDQRAPYHVTEAGSRNEQSLFLSRHTRQQKKIPRFKVNNFDISSQKNGTKLG